MAPIFALILAGGAGTRFWPASRARRPKQLLPLTGGEPMIRETARRVLPLVGGFAQVLVASGAVVDPATRALMPELESRSFLVEPVARNTAPCIAWAAWVVARRDPDAILIVLPSDHHVADEAAFLRTLEHAVAAARSGSIVTIGIRPTSPATGFGYIEVAAGDGPVRDGVRFVEKPDVARAEAFVAGGRHLWNAGMFIFRARDLVAAVEAHLPELAAGMRAFDVAAAAGDEAAAIARIFPTLPSVSIDVGVMEKLDRFAVVPGDFGWSDVGSWEAAWELARRDAAGNTASDSAVFVDARGNHVVDARAGGRPRKVIVLVGVDDLVVVETDDALLVVPRRRSQDVRMAVDRLRASDPEAL